MRVSGLFINPDKLNEGVNQAPFPRQSEDIGRIESRIKEILKLNKGGALLAYVGSFGSGKTGVLDFIEPRLRRKKHIWSNFDVWRYADRQQIWDGFVVEVTAAIRGEPQKKVAASIEGENPINGWLHQSVKNVVAVLAGGFFIWLILSWLLWSSFHGSDPSFVKSLLMYGLPGLVLLLGFFGVGYIFQDGKPIKRVFEMETVLAEALSRCKSPVIVVVEDVDRAGEEGVIFLETLRRFFDKYSHDISKGKGIIVIAPQSSRYLNASGASRQNFERGVKIYHHIIYYSGSVMHTSDATNVIKESRFKDEYKDFEQQFIDTSEEIIRAYGRSLSIRTYKLILREVNEFMMAFPDANPSIAFLFIIARVIPIDHTGSANKALEIDSTLTSELSKKTQFSFTSTPEIQSWAHVLAKVANQTASVSIMIDIKYSNTATAEIDISNNGHNTRVGTIVLSSKYEVLLDK